MTNPPSTGLWASTPAWAAQNEENRTDDFWAWHQSEMEKYAIYRAAPLFDTYGNYFLLAFGGPCNILTVITLLTISPRTSIIMLIIALAVFDTATLAVQVITNVMFQSGVILGDVGCSLLIGITAYYIPTFPKYIIALLSCERMVAVCFPLKAPAICTMKHAKQSMLAITVFLAVLCIFPSFAYRKVQYGSQSYCDVASKYADAMVTYAYIKTTLSFYVPWIVIFTLNAMIITKLLLSTKSQHDISGGPNTNDEKRKQNRSITTMLLSVSISMLVLSGTSASAALIMKDHWLSVGDPEYDAKIYFFNRFRAFLETANSAINFILYVLTGKRFREAFLALIFCERGTRLLSNG